MAKILEMKAVVERAYFCSPPTRPSHALSRAIARTGTLPRVCLLQAGPGYGKTFLLHQLVAGIESSTVWLTLDEGDHGVGHFFQRLIRGLESLIPGLVLEVPAASACTVAEAKKAWGACFEAWSAYGEVRVQIVLDGAEHLCVEDAAVLRGVVLFLSQLPPGVRLFVASRRRVPWPLLRLSSGADWLVLNQEQMAFSLEEAQLFFCV